MSIRVSDRLRLSLGAMGVVALGYAGVIGGLQLLTHRVEARGGVYPYRTEDWLRYLLPTLWQDSRPLILLTGPSTVRESMVLEDFERSLPGYRVLQGGVSSGTLGDVEAALAYVEQVHGRRALPEVIVLGISPRFMAEIPVARPFAEGLYFYSRYYTVPGRDATGFELIPKPTTRGLRDHGRFLMVKQAERYRTALAWVAAQLLLRVGLVREGGIEGSLARKIYQRARSWTEPYKYRNDLPMSERQLGAQLDNPRSWWHLVHAWDPDSDSAGVRARVAALKSFTARHEIELYLVNLPERSLSRRRYRPGFSARYQALVHSAFGTLPILDLRCLLADDRFLDAEHALLPGAQEVTRQTIRHIEAVRGARLHPADSAAARRVTESTSSGACGDLP